MMTNISRYIDFMSTNVKYITREAIEIDKEIFADQYLNMKFKNELDQACKNSDELMFYMKELVKKSNEVIIIILKKCMYIITFLFILFFVYFRKLKSKTLNQSI